MKNASQTAMTRIEGSTAPSILCCPNCLRTEFSSLQGLFNHACGTHSLAWTSHDECVRQCVCALEALQGGVVDFADLDVDPAFSRAEVEVDVAPYAMISVLTKLFVRALVRTGLEIAARDRQRALMHVDERARRLSSIADMFSHWEPRMLTPGHILHGVVARG
ncbi:hypothetical protein B0H10DRAFT_888647 [Mycena sp. CBHHK59/15]|nr:hypothetical protein B0H10DRAFT_888647 [Mycena sp. CBHHK59/15]